MKEERKKKLASELKYLLKEERDKELIKYEQKLADENVNIKELAHEIYRQRGIDDQKLNKNFFNNLADTLNDLSKSFKNKDSKMRNKMIVELIYIVLILALIKLPFDLIRDIGYDYLKILTTNHVIEVLWNLGFLALYTITLICAFILFIKNFNKKYNSN